jgi:hypothetical protein
MLQLIIKGNASAARIHAAEHGIALISAINHPKFNEAICLAPDSAEDKARAWFLEPHEIDGGPGVGYPLGTLTWYGTTRAVPDQDMSEG